MYASANTLDDLMRRTLGKLLRCKEKITPTKGDAVEIRGALLKLSNPRARLSGTETKGTIFSCLGELLWYLSGSDDAMMIDYYIKDYSRFAEPDGRVHGAYGPRLYSLRGVNQIENIRKILKRDDSRKSVIQLFSAEDLEKEYKDVPCTCTIQFFRRGGKLDLFVSMRSNDAFVGLPHDIFSFTMLQEILARDANLEVGNYSHAIGSLHLYDSDRTKVQAYLDEGWQTEVQMPSMPKGDPWPAVHQLLSLEEALRMGLPPSVEDMPAYWRDLGSLLHIYSLTKGHRHLPRKDLREVAIIKHKMSTDVYAQYIRRREVRLEGAATPLLELASADK